MHRPRKPADPDISASRGKAKGGQNSKSPPGVVTRMALNSTTQDEA
ncbi:unnamed protein product [Ectocarpus sp. CCAP 1310/34]|nr:unnamed protein product [Ectocarpus sp. CCAP 1310/34]